MKRSHWLPLITVAGVAFLASPLLSVAQAQSGPSLYNPDLSSGDLRKPKTPYAPSERLPKTGKQADLLASTDFYQFVTTGRERASNPDIAVGPDDILVVAGQNRIMRIPNPNSVGYTINGGNLPYTRPAPGTPGTPSPLANLNALRAAVPTSEVFFDTWIGTTVLENICPGQFNPQTCLIQYPTVRYDQMHGHFLVAFAVTDTGVRGPDQVVTQGRASTWVLLVSKYASFLKSDGTLGSVNAPAGTSRIFTLPLPPPDLVPPGGGNNTGGLNADWFIYYGSRDEAGAGAFLNLNMYTTHPAARPLSAPGRYSASFPVSNCNAPVGGVPPTTGQNGEAQQTVCYFPTEVRLGLDNDSIILSSPVYNVNQVVGNSNTIPYTTGRYAGNRVRVLSKYAIYNILPLINGDWSVPGTYTGPVPYNPVVGAGFIINPPSQTAFDMFWQQDLAAYCPTASGFTAPAGVGTCAAPSPTIMPRSYTLGPEISPQGSGLDSDLPPTVPVTPSSLRPLYYEPEHLRGRTMASYSNYPFGGYSHLVGTTDGGAGLYVQPIVYRPDYRPALDLTSLLPVLDAAGAPVFLNGPRFRGVPDLTQNPYQVPQSPTCSTTPCSSASQTLSVTTANQTFLAAENFLHIGDSRPRRVIYREGHLYDARVGREAAFGTAISTPPAANANLGNNPLWSTVYYDVVQTIYTSAIPALPAIGSSAIYTLPLPNPSLIFYTFWQNGHFYSPMFDVTANVVQSGAMSPSWTLPYFEKLFVGTTSPRFYYPSPGSQGNIWPSLYDVRQGIDKYDRFEWYRDPVSGRVVNPSTIAPNTAGTGINAVQNTTNLFSTRHGAATDPNLGGLWVYGAFADFRIAGGVGQWATHAAYYDMSFNDTDPYGTDAAFFSDVTPASTPFFIYIQTARQIGLTQYLNGGAAGIGSGAAGNPPHGSDGIKPAFEPDRYVTRAEMAAFIIYSQFDVKGVLDYLAKTGAGYATNTFADVFVGRSGADPSGTAVTITQAQRDAIEVMVRRGYTRGCVLTNDGTFNFCPFDWTTRGQMAVFVIRAKMNNVHPTVLSGCPTTGTGSDPSNPLQGSPFNCPSGEDKFWVFQTGVPYFPGDTPVTHPFYGYIQKLREMRITNGQSPTIYGSSLEQNPTDVLSLLTRGQMATFIVRAFHF